MQLDYALYSVNPPALYCPRYAAKQVTLWLQVKVFVKAPPVQHDLQVIQPRIQRSGYWSGYTSEYNSLYDSYFAHQIFAFELAVLISQS